MTQPPPPQGSFDIVAIGNAIVDVLAQTDEAFLVRHKLPKGSMRLIDEMEAESLYAAMGPATIISGGSAANTIVGAASLGAKTAFIGKVRDDEAGRVFAHDIAAMQVAFHTPAAVAGSATARSFILVTPDGERTMNTFLGACQNLDPDDIDESLIKKGRILYLEGYLWDPPAARAAFRKAADIAHKAGHQVAFTLSDTFCVDRYRDDFLNLMRDGSLDIVFANSHELKSLYQTSDEDTALQLLRRENVLGIVTRSSDGAYVVTRDHVISVPAQKVERVVDTTGAGDLFAAGFLTGLVRGLDHDNCARLGAIAAADIIQHMGARPLHNLQDLARQNGIDLS
jgi:sugar/nucleoside kinase (ribokinase family)